APPESVLPAWRGRSARKPVGSDRSVRNHAGGHAARGRGSRTSEDRAGDAGSCGQQAAGRGDTSDFVQGAHEQTARIRPRGNVITNHEDVEVCDHTVGSDINASTFPSESRKSASQTSRSGSFATMWGSFRNFTPAAVSAACVVLMSSTAK